MSDKLEMKYFVMNPNKDDGYGEASRDGIMAYAKSIESVHPGFSDDLVTWVRKIERRMSRTRAKEALT